MRRLVRAGVNGAADRKFMRKFRWLPSILSASDEQAMWRVQNADDHRAFGCLLDRWGEPIRQLCIRMLGDAHRGEDLCQDVFSKVYQRRHTFQNGAKFSTWLWRIALNACYDELRRVQRRAEIISDDPDASRSEAVAEWPRTDPAPPDLIAAQFEEGELVRRALLDLPEKWRTVVALRHYEGLKLREIAEILEIPEGTVNSRLAEALDRLARRLRPLLEETPAGVPAKPNHAARKEKRGRPAADRSAASAPLARRWLQLRSGVSDQSASLRLAGRTLAFCSSSCRRCFDFDFDYE